MRLLSVPLWTREEEALEPELIYSDREKDFCDLAMGPQNKPEDLVSPKGDSTHSTLPSKSVPIGFAQVEPLRVSMNNWEEFLFSQVG